MPELTLRLLAALQPLPRPVAFAKGEEIHRAGRVCRDVYVVEAGVLRAYYLMGSRDVTAYLAAAGEVIGPPDSLVLDAPSKYSVEAVTAARAVAISKVELERHLGAHPEHERLVRPLTQQLYVELVGRTESFVFQTAKERYDALACGGAPSRRS